MGFFKYPYTDLNELNLDWVIAKIKYIEQAKHIIFDNSGTPLVSNNVQDALEELYGMIATQGVTTWNGRSGVVVPEAGDYTASQVDYDNTVSGLTATETQSAIDELAARPLGGVESFNTRTGAVVPTAGDYSASDVTYDNSGSGLAATETQSAIDEVNNKIPATIVESFNTRTGAVTPAAGDYDAADITYDNTTSGMTATDAQGAIDELDNRLDNFSVNASQVSYDNTVSGLAATDAQAALDEIANDVLSSGVASFNGRTGAVNSQAGDYDLTDMGDVVITTPTDGQTLVYDANSLKWVNGAGGGGSSTLGGLTDVTLTSPSDGQVLTYDGNSGEWINSSAGVPVDGYALKTTTSLTTAAQSGDTWASLLKRQADSILTIAQALPNNQMIEFLGMRFSGGVLYTSEIAYLTNASIVASIAVTYMDFSSANLLITNVYSTTTLSNCKFERETIPNSSSNPSYTDFSSTAASGYIMLYYNILEKP